MSRANTRKSKPPIFPTLLSEIRPRVCAAAQPFPGVLNAIINFSLKNKFLVLAATTALVFGGIYALRKIPLDAIPDLSDTQVII